MTEPNAGPHYFDAHAPPALEHNVNVPDPGQLQDQEIGAKGVHMVRCSRQVAMQEDIVVVQEKKESDFIIRAVGEALRRCEEQGVVMDRRLQQVLHYTHEHVLKTQAQTEVRLHNAYLQHAQEQKQVLALQLAQIKSDFRVAHDNADASRQSSIHDAIRTMTEESEMRTLSEVKRFALEQNAAYDETLSKRISQSEANMELIARSHVVGEIDSVRDQFNEMLDLRCKAQERYLQDQLEIKLRSVQAYQDAASRDTTLATTSLERRIEEKLRDAQRRRMQENESLRNRVDELRTVAANDAQERIESHSKCQDQRWQKTIQATVSEQLRVQLPVLEEKIGCQLIAAQARIKADDELRFKNILDNAVESATKAAEAVVEKATSAHREWIEKISTDHIKKTLRTTPTAFSSGGTFEPTRISRLHPAKPAEVGVTRCRDSLVLDASSKPATRPQQINHSGLDVAATSIPVDPTVKDGNNTPMRTATTLFPKSGASEYQVKRVQLRLSTKDALKKDNTSPPQTKQEKRKCPSLRSRRNFSGKRSSCPPPAQLFNGKRLIAARKEALQQLKWRVEARTRELEAERSTKTG
ncbi:hypothetical protein DVH05_001986 [Phytophthora capsici]|nr:hypothetical protein DVH05_001933 [Phytophthora capsici]KAG1689781.1 hypothetical protein DVH05_001986 [Phytophthora capsici]